jgi:ATP/maltotriose-dependent transcriptional regulator MalT/DNA-binding SARP family transcriptional activator
MKETVDRHCQVLGFPVSSRARKGVRESARLAIKRPALNDLLVRSLNRRLLLILAPDGYGKTSALWQAVQALTHPVIWCALDTTEIPLAELIQGLVGRLMLPGGGSRKPAEPVERSPFGCAQALVEAVQRALPTGAHLVLDALDRCPGHTDAWGFLRHVLELAPPGVTVAVTTAARPEIRLSDLARNQALAQVGKKRLAFSREEVGALLSAAWDMPVGDTLIDEAYRLTAGWPQGLHALVAAFPEAPRDPRAIGASSVAESFVPPPGDDLLQHVEGLDRELLLSVAFLPTVDLSDVETLTGVPGTAARVRRMAQMSQALTQVEPERYVLHPTLRDQLISTARREWGPDGAMTHRAAVASLLESRGRLEESLGSFLEAHHAEGTSRILRALGPRYVMNHDPSRLLTVATRATETGARGSVFHLLCARAALARGDFTACLTHCDKGLQTAENAEVNLPLLVVRTAGRSALSPNLTLEDSWEELGSHISSNATGWPRVWLAAELLRIGKPTEADGELQKALGDLDASEDPFHAGWATLCRAQVHAQAGRYAAARGIIAKAAWLSAQTTTVLAAMHRRMIGEIEALSGDLTAASEHAQQAVETSSRAGAARERFFHLLFLADLQVWQGDLDGARRWLDEAEAVARGLPADGGSARHAVTASRGRLSWFVGAVDEALESLTEARQHRGETLYGELWNCLSAGHVLIRAGHEEDAEDTIVDVLEQAEQMGSQHLIANALLLLAYGSQTAGDPSEVAGYLRRFWATVRTHGYRFMPASDAELIVWAERNDPAKGEKQTRRAALVTPAQHEAGRAAVRHVAAGVPWPLANIDTLGPLCITVRGTACEDVWKSSLKAKRLLEIMLSADGLRATADEAVDHLWPTASGDKGKHSLHNEISNLRRILSRLELEGHVEVRREQDAYRLYCSKQVRVTDRQFEALARRGLAAAGSEETHGILKEAADLLTGPFLQDAAYERFPEERRRQLSELAAECLHALADSPLSTDEDAVSWWERALEGDQYDEEAYEGIIRTCLRLGQKSKAGKYYSLMMERLVDELGCELPSWARGLASQVGRPNP